MTTEEEPEPTPPEDNLDELMDAAQEAINSIVVPAVTTPSGAALNLLTEQEQDYYESSSAKYQTDNIIINMSDIQELERILLMETLVYRWSQWIAEEKDYFGDPVNVMELQKNIKEYSSEIRLVKKALGIDKATREKEHGETVADYIHNLKLRAQEFGIHRNNQAVAAITLWQELVGVVQFHMGSSPDERNEFHANESDVIKWVVDHIPVFEEIDDEFRKTSQQYWIRDV